MRTEKEVRKDIKKYFGIKELVGGRTYRTHYERAWRFLDYRLLYSLLIVREEIGKAITVNHGRMEQRGLRTIAQQIVKNKVYNNKLYISAHLLGKAVDFDVKDMTAQQVRDWIVANQNLFPYKIRLEDKVSWVHMDVIWESKNKKVYLFDPPR